MDHSAMTVLLSCPRKYEYLHVRRRAEEHESHTLATGRAWHKITETYGRYRMAPTEVHFDVEAVLAGLKWQDVPDNFRTGDKLKLGFLRWQEQHAPGYTWLDVEHGFYCDIPGASEPLEGRIDGRVLFDAGEGRGIEQWIVDYKHTSRLMSNWAQAYRLSDQFKLYTVYGRTAYHDIAGVVVDLFHITKGNKSGATPGEREGVRFYRLPFRFAQSELDEAQQTFKTALDLKQWYTERRFFPPNRSACQMYGRLCGFADVCDMARSADRETMLASYPPYTFSPHTED